MEIIPVIDLLDGQVVHAKKGQRQSYQPIQSSLCQSSEPIAICNALLELYPFKTIYIADLNAIQQQNSQQLNHFITIQSIQQKFPLLNIWLDAGVANRNDLSIWENCPYTRILGSENFTSLGDYLSMKSGLKDFVLSLDFFSDGFRGPHELLSKTEYWPQRVIAMSLTHVGAAKGPNMALHHQLQQQSPLTQQIAAGGIRNAQDLYQLKDYNVTASLVASALHSGAISYADLYHLMQ